MKNKSIIHNVIGLFLIIAVLFFVLQGWEGEKKERLQTRMMEYLYPFCEYVEGNALKGCCEETLDKMCFWYLGLSEYMEEDPVYLVKSEDEEMINWILLQEGRDEGRVTEDEKKGAGDGADQVSENTAEKMGQSEEEEDAGKAMDAENEARREKLMQSENEEIKDARRSEKVWKTDEERVAFYESLKDFETLKKEFYQIDKNTNISADQLDAQKLFSMDLTMKTKNDQPQILIYHTHSQEAFADSVPGDASTTIVGAGERLSELLREYGYNVIHHTGEYDVENRDYAYSYAGPAIEKLLEENPSIEVIIDLHRDGVAEDTRLVTEVDGVKMAQFMFFNGLSRLNMTGDIDYLENPYIEENLALSFQLQLAAREYYPGLARRIYLKGYRYNMHYRPKSILLELGAQTNTVEEIMNALQPIAHILDEVLSPKETEEAEQ